jgi:predicted esterase
VFRRILKYGLLAALLGLLVVVLLGIGPSLFTYALTDVAALPPVAFLTRAPFIDGVLDSGLERLTARDFPLRFRLFHSGPGTQYRLAHGVDFLYLFIQADGTEIVQRDRGYQHGDGFHMVLATPPSDGGALADRFFVLGFSPQDDPARAWARKVVWYHDVATRLSKLPDDVLFAARVSNGNAGYELLLPWRVVGPYHPWREVPIGFNLCFVKGVGAGGMVMDFVLFDWRLQAEQQRRRFVPLTFEPPAEGVAQVAVLPPATSVEGEPLRFEVVACGGERSEELAVRLATSEGEPAAEPFSATAPIRAGAGVQAVSVDQRPTRGTHVMTSRVQGVEVESELLVLPRFDVGEVERTLEDRGSGLSPGDRTTLGFAKAEIAASIARGRLNERLLRKMETFFAALDDPGALHQGGAVFRRAFVSPTDGTTQPYTVRLPAGYDRKDLHPLLVFLHGSGVHDERAASVHDYLDEERYVQLFPYGRGMSHNYATEEAQTDIREAIADVAACYSVDTSRIVLGGFSMGGYGVYRTFWESPEMFRALLVLSGDPYIPWLQRTLTGGHYPPVHERLEIFEDTPLFVFHGTEDRNNPFERTAAFVRRLQSSGACCVEFHTEEAGHEVPRDPKTLDRLHAWLGEVAPASDVRPPGPRSPEAGRSPSVRP